nr:ATP-binding protein [Thermoproteota archaeon]
MAIALKVHPSFFKEFATKTWVSPADVVKELVENAFDEDATRVLITILSDNSISIEDNAGMDESEIQKFLLLGSPHKKVDSVSPKFKRIRTGRYGTGRLSFLT